MMSLELWLAFTGATIVILVIPGPTVLLVVSYALGRGRGSGWATVPGVVAGDFVAMTASLAGAGALLAASATLFAVLKYAGAAYLIWLGIQMWRTQGTFGQLGAPVDSPKSAMFWNAFVVTALNPKSIVFFVAFVPQFIDPARPLLPQLAIMEATFLGLAAATVTLWALLAGRLRETVRRPGALKVLTRAGGSVVIGAGLATAVVGRGD